MKRLAGIILLSAGLFVFYANAQQPPAQKTIRIPDKDLEALRAVANEADAAQIALNAARVYLVTKDDPCEGRVLRVFEANRNAKVSAWQSALINAKYQLNVPKTYIHDLNAGEFREPPPNPNK